VAEKKSVGWSKPKDEKKTNGSSEENTSQEDDMELKQFEIALNKSNENLVNRLKETFGGNTPPGGEKMDQDTKDYLDKIGQGLEKQGKMLEGLFGERERKENENRVKQIINDALKPVIGEQKFIRGLVCDDEGNCRLPTKEELATVKTEQDKKLEKIKEEAKKIPEGKPDFSQLSGQDLWNQIKLNETYVEDVSKIHIKKVKEDPDYRDKILDVLCDPKNEQCRVDVMEKFNKFSEQEEKTEKEEKTPEGKKFFLVK